MHYLIVFSNVWNASEYAFVLEWSRIEKISAAKWNEREDMFEVCVTCVSEGN